LGCSALQESALAEREVIRNCIKSTTLFIALKCLEALARHLNYRRAALELGISQAAYDKGEVACEQLGSLVLLSQGIHAFKVDAIGARTDLVFSEPSDESFLFRGVEGLVLTEWKVATDANALARFKAAQKQADSAVIVRLFGEQANEQIAELLRSEQDLQRTAASDPHLDRRRRLRGHRRHSPSGSVGSELEADAKGERWIWLERVRSRSWRSSLSRRDVFPRQQAHGSDRAEAD
jgi:hypothetical protein